MASFIYYKNSHVIFNNKQFYNTICFISEVAHKKASQKEMIYVKKIDEKIKNYWPGMMLDIQEEFPDLPEKKFWYQIFMQTAQQIFEGNIGDHSHKFWQVSRIYQIYASGQLILKAIKEIEPEWHTKNL